MWEKCKAFFGQVRNLNRENSVLSLSAEAAYYLILNAVPFLMLLINIIFLLASPYSAAIKSMVLSLPMDLGNVAGKYTNELELIQQLVSQLPYDVSKVVRDQIDIILASRMRELTTAGALSLGFTVWASTQGIGVLVQAADPENYLNRYAPVLKFSKAWLIVRCKAMLFAVGMVGIIGLCFLLMLSGNLIFYSLNFLVAEYPVLELLTRAPLFLWNIILYFIPFILLLLILTVFYRYAPSRFNRHSWRSSFFMGLVVSVMWMISAGSYSFYLSNHSLLGPLYGSLFGIVLLVVWLRVISGLIICGSYLLLAYDNVTEEIPPEALETGELLDGTVQ